jgi:hypothetical protein
MVIAAENAERGGCRKMTSGELEPQPKCRLRLRPKCEVMPNDYANFAQPLRSARGCLQHARKAGVKSRQAGPLLTLRGSDR